MIKTNISRIGFLLAQTTCCCAALWAQVPQERPASNLMNIHFQDDIRVFSVMAAINAAGFDYERDNRAFSDVRQEVRQALSELDPVLVAKLRTLYQQQSSVFRGRDKHIAYTSLALLLSDPPEFELKLKETDMPGDTWRVRAFQRVLPEFYKKARIQELWDRFRERYRAELAGYLPVLESSIAETLDYFRVPTRVMLDRRIILIPDLLNAHDIVNARNLERSYYIVVGPTDDPANNRRQLQHEYLHSLVDPLTAKYGAALLKHEKLLELAQRQPDLRSDLHSQFLLVAAESLIESIQLRMEGLEEEVMDLKKVGLYREGLILTPYFLRALEDYEKNELLSLPAYLEIIVDKIKDSEVEKDAQRIAELESRLEETRRQAEDALEVKNEEVRLHNQRVRRLNQAGSLLSEDKYDEAEAELRQLLADDPADGVAFFYMGQIESRRGRHSESFDWYRKASEAPVEPWIRARSLLAMGRIAASRGAFEDARGYFEQVDGLSGDLKGAREEATQLISQLPRQ